MRIDNPQPSHLVLDKTSIAAPLVTIAIPTYRRDGLLAEALLSALRQDAAVPIEIIVVDNDPESKAAVLSSANVKKSPHDLRYFVNRTNLGMFGNWNQCISLARGRWITLLHDDDWLSPAFISKMLPLLLGGIDFAVCRVAVGPSSFDPEILKRWRDNSKITPLTLDDLIFGNPSPAPGLLILREALVTAGGFDPTTYPCGDYITYARCARGLRTGRLNQTLAYYRTTDSQTFKEDTLQTMVRQSIDIKQELLRNAPAASTLTYILSMAFWFRLARQHGKPIDSVAFDWRLKTATALSHAQPVALVLQMFRKSLKYLAS